MTRDEKIEFCIEATADLHGIDKVHVDKTEFTVMSDEELEQETNWLSDMLDK